MEFKTMSMEELESRKAAIAIELDAPDADLDALNEEVRGINEEIETRKAAEAKREEIRKSVAAGAGNVIKTFPAEVQKVQTVDEIRNSKEYIDAYAEYTKTGNDKECRALLTTNATNGVLPVPEIVEETIKTAWERDGIMSRVRRTFIRGNVKVAFELSADPAYVHTEGTSAPTEESLTLGIVTLVPGNIKKWIRVSDEVMAMGGEAFLRYIYDEITYQIVKKEAALAVNDIATAKATSDADEIGVPAVTAEPSVIAVPTAAANLSDEAEDLVVIMNRLSEAAFLAAQAAGNFSIDPFMGLPRVYTSELPAYSTASSGDVYAIVGDLRGEQFNYPEGDDVIIKFDDLTEAEEDMVKIVGRVYAAHGLTQPGRFVNIKKPAEETTT